jgi:hypothetical protein
MKYYVGVFDNRGYHEREVFQSEHEPIVATHGDQYLYCIGPFETVESAEFMAGPGFNNPHCITPNDAVRLCSKVRAA